MASLRLAGLLLCVFLLLVQAGNAQPKTEKTFHAVVTDTQGVETEVKNLVFYWEEKVSETAFVPHELRQIPVKRGTSTVNIRFDNIRQIEVKPGPDRLSTLFIITLSSNKVGEFGVAIPGSFKGESDFGEVEIPAHTLKRIVFK